MLTRCSIRWRCALVILATTVFTQAHADMLAFWDFNSPTPDADATTGTLLTASGTGTASLVGGVTGSFTASNGSSDPNTTDNSNWRVTTWPVQGKQNKLSGVQFNASTVGHRKIAVNWDLRTSNTASKYTRLQYTTNGTDFVDFQVITMPFETWVNGQSANLSGVPGVENNPDFGVRFVTEFESTAIGSGETNYVPCNPASTYGSAGTLRFDMVSIFGEPPAVRTFSVLTYNVLGRSVGDWTTNSTQVQAIGRQLSYLKPDIVGFQEIPETNSNYRLMTNFVDAYLPGYYLAIGSYTDGGERSVVASRFPIPRAKSWLVGSSLTPYGYGSTFSRDLFEAQIDIPGFPQPFHFFVTHLKAASDQNSSMKRGAEARAISNYFAAVYLTTNSLHPYCLVGDMNEDIFRPRQYELQAIQNLIAPSVGLRLTTPVGAVTGDDRTWSIRNANLTIRFDYILPCALLFSNIANSQIFRSDAGSSPSPPLLVGDSATASDHLPVMMTFRNPYNVPTVIRGLTLSNNFAILTWPTVKGAKYRVESSADLIAWFATVTNLIAPGGDLSCSLPAASSPQYFRVCQE